MIKRVEEQDIAGCVKVIKESFSTVAKKFNCNKINISIVEENNILRKWYESFYFVHIGTQKFDFFPFTCGYMERNLQY